MDKFIFGYHAALALLKNTPENARQIYIQQNKSDARTRGLLDLAKQNRLQVVFVLREKLDIMVDGEKHQGVVVEMKQDFFADEVYAAAAQNLEEFLRKLHPKTSSLLLILDGVQDPHNLGACLRTASAAGVAAVIVPKDNAVGITSVVRKVACGAAESVNFFQVTNLARALDLLKQNKFWIYGADAGAAQSIFRADFSDQRIALVLGAEGHGLRRLTKEKCDFLVSIPLKGEVASLNVSVAAGICLFEVVRQVR